MSVSQWAAKVQISQWYAIAIAAITVVLVLHCFGTIVSLFLITRFQLWTLRNVAYPLLVPRKYYRGVTRLQAGVAGGYLVANGVAMGIGIKTTSDLLLRSGMMAAVNMIPLFLGGRTSMLANFLGISLHSYYLAHHWIGRIVIVQSLLHVALVIAARKPWSFDTFQISGISAASALALILLSSLYIVRRLVYEFFLKLHVLLAFVTVLALLQHLLVSKSSGSIFPIVSLVLWGLNMLLRLLRIAYYSIGGKAYDETGQAAITPYSTEDIVGAIKVTVELRKSLHICRPGQYMYLSFSGMGLRRRFQSHPYVIVWWDDSLNAMSLSFLIQPKAGISVELLARNSIRSVAIDGPYGKDLRLDSYETVILVAKGIGIAGILPYIRHMTYRRISKDKEHEAYRRGLITRKIDVYWVLENNSQADWVSEWITKLHQRDSKNLILTFSCFYPDKESKPPPVAIDEHWKFVYQKEALPIIENLMVKQLQRSPGKTKVAACGDAKFTGELRSMVIETMDEYQDVEFVETEFQPDDLKQSNRRDHTLDRDDIEMSSMSIVENVTKGNRLVRSKHSTSRGIKSLRSRDYPNTIKGFVKKHSGVTNKLDTLKENDELLDIEEEDIGSKAEPREIV